MSYEKDVAKLTQTIYGSKERSSTGKEAVITIPKWLTRGASLGLVLAGILTFLPTRGSPISAPKTFQTTDGIALHLNLTLTAESANDYDAICSTFPFSVEKGVTQMTRGEFLQLGKKAYTHCQGTEEDCSSAMGGPQIIYTTAKRIQDKYHFDLNYRMDENFQSLLFSVLILKSGYNDFYQGKISDSQRQVEYSKLFATIATDDTDESFYEGENGNHAVITDNQFDQMIAKIQHGKGYKRHLKTTIADRDIHKLDTELAIKFLVLQYKAMMQGYHILLTEGMRSQKRQRHLYTFGRSGKHKHKDKVTWTLNSNHKHGDAFDFHFNAQYHGKTFPDDPKLWRAVGAIGKELGLKWGGDWKKKKDFPHFEI